MVGDQQSGTEVGHMLDSADLDPEPLLEEEPQHRPDDGVVVLRVETEFVDGVVAGQALTQEISHPGDALGEIARPGIGLGAALLELPDDGFDLLVGLRMRKCRGVPPGSGGALRRPLAGTAFTMQRNNFRFRPHLRSLHSPGQLPHRDATATARLSTEPSQAGSMIGARPRPRTKSSNASSVVHPGSKPNSRRIRVVSITRP